MSESKTRLRAEVDAAKKQRDWFALEVIFLLQTLVDLEHEHPDAVNLGELLKDRSYPENIWHYIEIPC